jgi:epoxyqueuosine reductase
MGEATVSLKDELKAYARAHGADMISVAAAEAFDAHVPNKQKSTTTALGMKSLVVFGRHMLTGALGTYDVPLQGVNSHMCVDEIDRISLELCGWLEERGYLGIPSPPEAAFLDLDPTKPMGTLDFKWVAEAAGMGTAGLELNLLTPEYGPRQYMGVVMTDLELPADEPLPRDLCPGLKCGRCAVTCPTEAIPQEAHGDAASVREYRNLNKRQCSLGAQRIGIRALHLNLEDLVFQRVQVNPARLIDSRYMRDWWQSNNSKVGAFAACFECWYVCPVGKDFRQLIKNPYRKQDIPIGGAKTVRKGERIGIVHLGPPADRQAEYERDKEFIKAGTS